MAEVPIQNTSLGSLAPQGDVHEKPRVSAEPASTPGLQICMGDALVEQNAQIVSSLAQIVNDAFGEVEANIFVPGYRRTNEKELETFIQKGYLAISYVLADSNPTSNAANPSLQPVGCVFIKQLSARLGNFGMLAVDPKYRGQGLGRAMIDFAENFCRDKGCTAMQMELLVTTNFEHVVKSRMQEWYRRLGYQVVKLGNFEQDYPSLANLLATPVDLRVFEKALI
ncbi:hypothetical protein E4U32_000298 [Claviceps aff. humidiphila group G2b]|nr:hypothetical protein E4U32_000298 [Claviceps aff. humidiphila group G2b]